MKQYLNLWEASGMIDQLPQWILLLHGFIAGALTVWLGLQLVNISPHKSKILATGLFYSIFGLYIRTIDCPYGAHVIILVFFLVFLVRIFWDVYFYQAALAVIVGFTFFGVAEAVFLPMVLLFLGLTAGEIATNPLYCSLVPLPQITVMLIAILLSKHYHLHLADYSRKMTDHITLTSKQQKIVIGLIILFLLNILTTAICNLFIFDKGIPEIFKTLSLVKMGIISNIALLTTLFVGILLVKELIKSSEKEALLQYQAEYIDTFDELYTAIRAEKHDMINHLQTILGFTQLGIPEEIAYYLKELLGQQVFSSQSIYTAVPAVTSLLFIKSNLAASKETRFNFDLNGNLQTLSISFYELNKILGNLINNALDAVSTLPPDMRMVQVTITEDVNGHLFEVLNSGRIDPALLPNIFTKGYSTKGEGHIGIGLYTVKALIEKNSGTITVNNTEQGVLFSVYIPHKKLERSMTANA
jgi:signal transduction histidine kinase